MRALLVNMDIRQYRARKERYAQIILVSVAQILIVKINVQQIHTIRMLVLENNSPSLLAISIKKPFL